MGHQAPIPSLKGYKIYSFICDTTSHPPYHWEQTNPLVIGTSSNQGIVSTPGDSPKFFIKNQPINPTTKYYAFAVLYGGIIRNSPLPPYRKMNYSAKIKYLTVKKVYIYYQFIFSDTPPYDYSGQLPTLLPYYSRIQQPPPGDYLPPLPWPQNPYQG